MTQACIQKHEALRAFGKCGMLRKQLWSRVLGPVPGTGELKADPARARSREITACGRMKSVCGFRTPGQGPEVGQEEGNQVEAHGQNKMPIRAERFQRG